MMYKYNQVKTMPILIIYRQTTMLIQSEAGASTANVENVIRIVGKHVFDYNII